MVRPVLLAALLLAGCSSGSSEAPASTPAPATSKPRMLFFIGIDGCRPDALQKAQAPALKQLAAEGASTFQAKTQMKADTLSAPGWTSILTGVDADKHKIVANLGFESRDKAYPTFLSRAQQAGLPVFLAPAWLGISKITEPDGLAKTVKGNDEQVTSATHDALLSGDYRVFFIHYDAVDHEGHESGFSPDNEAYVKAIEGVDARVQTLLDAVRQRPSYPDEDWLIAAATDHGGEGTDHGPRTPVNQTVWQIYRGPGVVPGLIPEATQMDVHPTVLRFLGVPVPTDAGLDGHVIALAP